jgi:hypothetical protein
VAEFWREPITNAKPQHVSGIPTIPGMSKVVWLMDAENAKWLLAAKGCVNLPLEVPVPPDEGHRASVLRQRVRPSLGGDAALDPRRAVPRLRL